MTREQRHALTEFAQAAVALEALGRKRTQLEANMGRLQKKAERAGPELDLPVSVPAGERLVTVTGSADSSLPFEYVVSQVIG